MILYNIILVKNLLILILYYHKYKVYKGISLIPIFNDDVAIRKFLLKCRRKKYGRKYSGKII